MNFAPDSACAGSVIPAANFGDRRESAPIDMLVLHYTGMADEIAARDWLVCEFSRVSSHYLVFEDGRIVQMVAENKRAWHAGKSAWRGHVDINSRSIGVEVCNPGHEHGYRRFPDNQIEAVIELCCDIVGRHPIEPRNVVAHSDIAPARKRDPGELFPWHWLASEGIGHWVEAEPNGGTKFCRRGDTGSPVEMLQELMNFYGYGVEKTGKYDFFTEQCVAAFQRHFRPAHIDGMADRSTVRTLTNLVAGLPDC